MDGAGETQADCPSCDWCRDCRYIFDCPIRDGGGDEAGVSVRAGSRVLERGDSLFRAGDPAESLYLLKSGALKGYTLSPAGEERVVAFYLPGDLIGLEAMESTRQSVCVEALSVSRTCTLPRDEMTALCARSESVLHRLLGQAGQRLRHDASMFSLLGCRSAEQRVAAFLLELSRRLRKPDSPLREFDLKMTRADMGSYLALAVETVSRALTRLQESGAIELECSRRVCIVDCDAMELAAGGAYPAGS